MSYNMSPNKKMKKKPMAEINVVPYIDVMLVLLVIFMVTAPLLNQGVKVDKLGKDEELAKPLDLIAGQVAKIVKLKPETQILVWGDTSVAYGKVVDLMSRLTQAGAQSVGLVTEPPR
jgi:biopolymer transport protein TolR